MIIFFKRTRQFLLKESKYLRYLFYVIGEILLVVVGILIALHINNWNEDKKKEELEISLLKEMQENLKFDLADMQINIGLLERGINSTKIILEAFDKTLPYNDTLNKHYGKVSIIPKLLLTKAAYNSMNDEGMRIVKNDSLRNEIIHQYEIRYAFILEWVDSEWDVQFQDHREIYRKHFKEFHFYRDLVPLDYYKLSKDQNYINYLNHRIGWLSPTIGMYERNGIDRAKKLIELIEQELKVREK